MAKIEEAKMEESKDHSLIAFRQNANNLTRRKEAQAEILQEKMVEEDELRKEINEKKKMMEKEFGTAPMNEAQFKGFNFIPLFVMNYFVPLLLAPCDRLALLVLPVTSV